MREKKEILGAQKKDIIELLRNIGKENILDNGEAICKNCGCNITWDNLGGIYSDKKKILFICDNLECIEEYN